MLMVINIQNWQSRNEQARKDDQRLLFNYLLDLEKNYRPLLDVLRPSSCLLSRILP